MGRAIPLDPIRLLIFIVPLLGAVAVTKLPKTKRTHNIGLVIIALLLIVPNLTAVPAHLLLTDVSQKPPLSEGHYTPQQWAASEWSAVYNHQQINGYERGLWIATGNPYTRNEFDCGDQIIVIRADLENSVNRLDIIYSNSKISLGVC